MPKLAAIASEAREDCFNELDVEQYVIVGTLDKSTCSTCAGLDSKVYPMSEYAVGTTAPPFHPWCRCTTAPYFEDMQGIGERSAKDEETGVSYYGSSENTGNLPLKPHIRTLSERHIFVCIFR